MLRISRDVTVPAKEIEISAIRAQGAGGQNVNKVSSAVHLRFDIDASSLPATFKARLLKLEDRRVSTDGVIVIKAQQHRSQELNRDEALRRLRDLIRSVAITPKVRKPTKPTRASQYRRVDEKIKHGALKRLRTRVLD